MGLSRARLFYVSSAVLALLVVLAVALLHGCRILEENFLVVSKSFPLGCFNLPGKSDQESSDAASDLANIDLFRLVHRLILYSFITVMY